MKMMFSLPLVVMGMLVALILPLEFFRWVSSLLFESIKTQALISSIAWLILVFSTIGYIIDKNSKRL